MWGAALTSPCQVPSPLPVAGSSSPLGGAGDLGEEEGAQKQASSMIVSFIGLVGCLKLAFSMDTWEVWGRNLCDQKSLTCSRLAAASSWSPLDGQR